MDIEAALDASNEGMVYYLLDSTTAAELNAKGYLVIPGVDATPCSISRGVPEIDEQLAKYGLYFSYYFGDIGDQIEFLSYVQQFYHRKGMHIYKHRAVYKRCTCDHLNQNCGLCDKQDNGWLLFIVDPTQSPNDMFDSDIKQAQDDLIKAQERLKELQDNRDRNQRVLAHLRSTDHTYNYTSRLG